MLIFNEKIVVITGGNSGIGKAVATKFSNEGAKVVIFGRDEDKLQQVQKTLQNASIVAGDVCKIEDLDLLFQTTNNKFGKIDVLVACAGIGSRRAIDDVDENYFDEMVNPRKIS